jgi:hypothetical protein
MDARRIHPYTAIVSGPTGSGKTQFIKKLMTEGDKTVDGPPEKIIFLYGEYQSAYDDMRKSIENIQFIEGFPPNMESLIDPKVRNLVVIDDLMTELSGDTRVMNMFTKTSHHRNMSVIFIVQNLFLASKQFRTISLNAHYMILFKNPRDNSQIIHLAKQIFPGRVKFVQESFMDATRQQYGYLLLDLRATTPDDLRLRTDIFQGLKQTVYVPRV